MTDLRTPSVPALDRALTILEALAESKKGFSLADLSRKLELPRSSTHCMLLTLERRGYLHRHEQTSKYLFGLKLFSLANMAIAGIEVREQAVPFLDALMRAVGLTVHLAILERGEAVLVHKVEPPGLLRMATWLGKRMDVHCTGVGKALIAYLQEEEIDRLIKEHGLPRHNENTIASPRKLKEYLAQVRKLGYAVEFEEDEIGLRCIGAPVFDHTNRVVAAVSVAGTVSQVTEENLSFLVGSVIKTASAISRQLGYLSLPASSGEPRAR
jgi:DNA-binding IclR family transcriptional regulator